jgi:hypothetical protein
MGTALSTPSRFVALLLLATACGRERAAPAAQADSTVAPEESLNAYVVEGEGLRLFVVSTGAARPLPFGSDSAVVQELITRTAHASPVETGAGGDCPGSFARWENGLTLRYRDGRFIGWSLQGGDASVTTASGAGIGTTRAELEDAIAIDVRNTSLGVEFTAGKLAGVLDRTDSTGKVTNLWAGEVCIAR